MKDGQRVGPTGRSPALGGESASAVLASATLIPQGHRPGARADNDKPSRELARELHDCVMQDLWYLQLQLASMTDELPENCRELYPQIAELKRVAQGTYEELRKILGLLKSGLPSCPGK